MTISGNTHYWYTISLASRLNGYMYSNGKSLEMALFILMVQLLGVKIIPCRVAFLIGIQLRWPTLIFF